MIRFRQPGGESAQRSVLGLEGEQALTQRKAGRLEQEVEAAADAALGEVLGGRQGQQRGQPDEGRQDQRLGQPCGVAGRHRSAQRLGVQDAALVPLGVEAAGQLEG